jgi:MFS family permease
MKKVLPVIVISQFLCTSLWFAGNAIMPDIAQHYHIEPSFLAHITSAVQLGFIAGTLAFAIFTIADRFSPVYVFFIASIAASICNFGVSLDDIHLSTLLLFRFLTGFFLAGIYPVGMKIASDHYQKGLGKSLGFLVGALVLGTAFPHLLKSFTLHLPWKSVVYATSVLSIAGGVCMLLFVPDGPHRKPGQKIKLTAFLSGFKNPSFRGAAFGYFGHMWELYTFWAFIPVMLLTYLQYHANLQINISFTAFLVIGAGSIGCATGGLLSQKFNAKKIAGIALFLSGTCCVLSPLVLLHAPLWLLFLFLLIWGITATADSPLFSTLVAQNAPEETRGTALTIVNCIGFSITIISIQVIRLLMTDSNGAYIYLFLAPGPLFGLLGLFAKRKAASD